MTNYSFDQAPERRGTHCVKWDEQAPWPAGATPPPGDRDLIPMWVADMDFAVAPPIHEAIARRAAHPVYGYTVVESDYYDALTSWFSRRHGWQIEPSHVVYTTGVVPAVSCALKALTLPGEKVVTLTPAYNCFFSSIANSGCQLSASLLRSDGPGLHFTVDWDDLERRCADAKATVFLLCNPHNPTGRVWTREELERMAAICRRHGVAVVSDEIHCELVMPGHRFVPFATVSADAVVLNSPSKAFNIAGLQVANIVCADSDVRRRIDRAVNINEVCDLGPFGPVALVAAYNEGGPWLDALNDYLWGNYQALVDFFATAMPRLRVTPLEGTYLVWVDVSALAVDSERLCEQLLRQGLWVNPGTMYGQEGFIRLNIACPRSRMMEGLRRLAAGVDACGK